MAPTTPYGSWPSPISAELIVRSAASLGEIHVDGTDVWWSELRPEEAGRVVLVRRSAAGVMAEPLPEDYSARTRVHEYGGGAWIPHAGTVYFSNWGDQRLYGLDAGASPRALTPAGPARYADLRVTAGGGWLVAVRETHGAGEPVNEIVAVATDGTEERVLVRGPDFVSFPRLSPDGHLLAWTQWNHPSMPWDETELWVADFNSDAMIGQPQKVAGGAGESVFQPGWDRAGRLGFVSDRSDWWNLYRFAAPGRPDPDAAPDPLAPIDGDIGVPQWVFDQSRYAHLRDGSIVCAYAREGRDHLGILPADGRRITAIDAGFTSYASLRAAGDRVLAVAASPTDEPAVVAIDPETGRTEVLRPARDLDLAPKYLARPEFIEFATEHDRTAHALFYPPTHPDHVGPHGERPPLVVMIHGGPTSAARSQLDLGVQYWTSRGVAVVDVNYGGSTGYGRPYRERLGGQWGVVDVDDCINAALYLAEQDRVDRDRLAIRGGSAGGFTTLAALTFGDVFSAGASHYGVADLTSLARDTHKFESRYLDGLVGPYPADEAVYRDRSPIHHTDLLSAPLIIFQGADDEVVPPSQAEAMVSALADLGLPFAYLCFEGEQHGFRQAANIRRALEAELYFYAEVFGFELADPVEPVRIE